MTRMTLTRTAATLAGALLALGVASIPVLGLFGIGAMLAPLVFGLVVLGAVAVVETMVKPPAAPGLRTASLQPRRVVDYLPWRLTWIVAAGLALLVAVLVLTTATASEDETLGGMRQISCDNGVVGGASGPYAGGFYSGPLAIGLVLLLLVAGLAARQVVLRPRGVAGPGEDDDALRRRSLDVVVAATGVAVGASLAGVALFSGSAMLRLPDACAPGWTLPVGGALLVSGVLAGLLAVGCLVRVLAGQSGRVAS